MATPCSVSVDHSSPLALRPLVVTSFDQLESFAGDWNRLWAADPKGELFQRFEWARAWWRGFGSGVQLCTVVVCLDNEVRGILPLVRCQRTVRFLGAPESDYNDVICREEDTAQVLSSAIRALHNMSPRCDEIQFQNVPCGSRLMRHWPELSEKLPLITFMEPRVLCPTILLTAQRDEIFRALLGNHHFRRHRNKLEKAGKLVFRHIEQKDEALLHMQHFFQQQIRRRTLSETASRFREPEFRAMFEAFIQGFDLASELRLGVLELDGSPIAYHLGFQANQKFLMYQQSFDVDAWDLAPGDVLLLKLFEYARTQDLCEYDFSVGDETYKRKFANYTKTNWAIHLYPGTVRGRLRLVLRRARSFGADVNWAVRLKNKLNSATCHLGRLDPIRPLAFLRRVADMVMHEVRRSPYEFVFSAPDLFDSTPQHDSMSVPGQPNGPTCNLHTHRARLSELADLSLTHARIFTPQRLQEFRDHMRIGKSIWISFAGKELVQIARIQRGTSTPVASGSSQLSSAPAPVSLDLVEDIWTADKYRTAHGYAPLISKLLQSAGLLRANSPVICRTSVDLSPALMGKAPLLPQALVARSRLLHRAP